MRLRYLVVIFLFNVVSFNNLLAQKVDVDGDLEVNGRLSILDQYKFPATDGAPDQILTTDGSGFLAWKDNSAGSPVWGLTGINAYRLLGNVGIGLNNPQASLHILEGTAFPQIRLEGDSDRFVKFFNNGAEEGLVGMNAQDLFILNRKLQGKVRIGAHGQSTLVLDAFGNAGIGETNPTAKLHVKDNSTLNTIFQSQGNKQIEFRDNARLEGRIRVDSFAFQIDALGDFKLTKGGVTKFNFSSSPNLTTVDITTSNSNFYFGRFLNQYNGYLGGNSSGFRLRGPSFGSLSLGTANKDVINISANQVDILESLNFLEDVDFYDTAYFLDGAIFNGTVTFNDFVRHYNQVDIYNSECLSLYQEENSNDKFGIRFFKNNGNGSYSSNTGVFYNPISNDIQIGPNFFANGYNIGIGTAIPDGSLHIKESGPAHPLRIEAYDGSGSWSFRLEGFNNFVLRYNYLYRGSFDSTNGNYVSVSDRRLKEDIVPIGNGVLDKLSRIGIYSYFFKSDTHKKSKTFGFVAQEVTKLFPDVSKLNEEEQIYTLDYTQMSVLGIKAIQELNQKVKDQEAKIQSLEARLLKLESLITKK